MSTPLICNPQNFTLTEQQEANFRNTFDDWLTTGKIRRLWERDASLWCSENEAQALGWLNIIEEQLADREYLQDFSDSISRANFSDAIVLGMGGSSLCSVVLSQTFGPQPGFPKLHVLDSIDPAQIRACESRVDLSRTIFIVCSKSGSTIESDVLQKYFFDRVLRATGPEEASQHFIAITDLGSQLEQIARSKKFRQVFYGSKSIGGRYSALSNFGMVPAKIMGIDTVRFLESSSRMAVACSSVLDNPGVALGALLGTLALCGRDKVTILTSQSACAFGVWLEQLLAESTGKCGKGLVPVDCEPIGSYRTYDSDRVFVYFRLGDEDDEGIDRLLQELEHIGQPVIRIDIPSAYDLGQEWFRWQIATAVVGSIIRVNPFDQPDVESVKVATKKLINEAECGGSLPVRAPFFCYENLKFFADKENMFALAKNVGKSPSAADYLRAHLDRIGPGGYVAILAYIDMNQSCEEVLQVLRSAIRDARHSATCLGFGPRFLHSTGQLYRGGANTGVFLQITSNDPIDLPIPSHCCTFKSLKDLQAHADFGVFAERGRRLIRVDLGTDVIAGLKTLKKVLLEALT